MVKRLHELVGFAYTLIDIGKRENGLKYFRRTLKLEYVYRRVL